MLTRGTIQPNPAGRSPLPLTPRVTGYAPGVTGYADIGRCTVIDWSSPTAIHTANIDEPP